MDEAAGGGGGLAFFNSFVGGTDYANFLIVLDLAPLTPDEDLQLSSRELGDLISRPSPSTLNLNPDTGDLTFYSHGFDATAETSYLPLTGLMMTALRLTPWRLARS